MTINTGTVVEYFVLSYFVSFTKMSYDRLTYLQFLIDNAYQLIHNKTTPESYYQDAKILFYV